jgi:hypothetical protein
MVQVLSTLKQENLQNKIKMIYWLTGQHGQL